jgi:hypothetical protein
VKHDAANPFDIAEVLPLATSLELAVVEVVVHEGDVFPLVAENAAYFGRLVSA